MLIRLLLSIGFIAVLLALVVLLTDVGRRGLIYAYDEVRPYITQYSSPFCMSELNKQNIEFERVHDQKNGQCRILDAVKVRSIGETSLSSPALMTCGLALSLTEWVGGLNRLSQREFQKSISKLHHHGTYNCRKQRGGSVLSEHAYANGIDVVGFTIGGDYYTFKDDRNKTQTGPFLQKAYEKACSDFALVLGPADDKSHRDHLHLDNGTYLGLTKFKCIAGPTNEKRP